MNAGNSKKGFTLVEVIIVVAIIGVLGFLVIWNIYNNFNKANDAKRKADIQKISTAFEEYYSDTECYPINTILSSCGSNALAPYLDSIPCDPVYKEPYCYLPNDPSQPDCYQKYRILGSLKYLNDPVIKTENCDSGQFCGWEAECGAAVNIDESSGFNYGFASLNTTLANPIMPTPPPSSPPPDTGGDWACNYWGDCQNFGNGNPACRYFFTNNDCDNRCGEVSLRCDIPE